MGDFNDEPGDESIRAINKILMNNADSKRFTLINLSENRTVGELPGTIKHQGTWSVFDQVIVSESLAYGHNGIKILSDKAEIFKADFLLEKDESYSGYKPYRTYIGPGYHNGFSDHLPVSILIGKDITDN
jgi:hypothetical protein